MSDPVADHIWTVAAAKARLSELIDRVERDGPQTITRRGKEVAVVVATEEWHQKSARKGSLAEFFANSPLVGSGLEVEGASDMLRGIDLDEVESSGADS
jgi:prevent-host-death family protein